ncbi:GNAT family N-acetyltransferase [Enterococcus sp. 5H]|uniref:GNAT family N-acetyltransferase n=1 Tax=Enterococcus sp. 5H TaxID=1229490 RepID=UPI0023022764|nr:GNAT family N-acetyltransferase [Enterococcus sp. 5H]MDA9470035.1 putative acetyltransferase [Enterococcus sp. 5H]
MEIWLTANIEAHSFVSKKFWLDNAASVRKQLPQADLYIYLKDEKIIGFAGLIDNYLAGIFVESNFRNQGIGQKLLTNIKKNYQTLTLSVYQKNQKAYRFYLKQGFKLNCTQIDETSELENQLIWEKNFNKFS